MAGLYIHIPFCKKACNYCNFHFVASLKYKNQLLTALKQEIYLRKNYLENELIDSIYFGGGSPGILEVDEIVNLFDIIYKNYSVQSDAEISFEANPDDLSLSKIELIKKHTPINRFSLGVQSFDDKELEYLGRVHNSNQAKKIISELKNNNFNNITIDLIYGIPVYSDSKVWEQNLKTFFEFDLHHLSAYCLTLESKTPLEFLINKKGLTPLNEEKSLSDFKILKELTIESDFEHYEISNFAKNKKYSKHNTAYWKGVSYIGLGPSAHSYNGFSRQWNIANNSEYISCINNSKSYFEIETLTIDDQYNEYILTSLRTIWGVDIEKLASKFGQKHLNYFIERTKKYISNNKILKFNSNFKINPDHIFLSDGIISDLFV